MMLRRTGSGEPRLKIAMVTAVLGALLLLAPSTAAAQDDGVRRGFEPVGDYILELGGSELDKADIYYSQREGAYLILDSALEAPILVSPRLRRVETVHLMKVARQENGTVNLLPNATLAAQGEFEVVGDEARFTVAGTPAALKAKPPVLGPKTLAEMQDSDAGYLFKARTYQASEPILAQLRERPDRVEVQVYFGTWCPFCSQMVPRMMRVAEELAESNIEVGFYGLPRQINQDSEARRFGISSVPTGIVYVGGREVGRITGQDWKVPELTLNRLLQGG